MTDEISADDRTARRSERYPIEGVRGRFVLTSDARVVNLGLDGMAIECGSPLQVGRTYSLSLTRAERTLQVDGRVVWCSLVRTERGEHDEVLPFYRAGIQFRDVIVGKAAEVAGFLSENAVTSLEKRLFGRFRLARDKAALVGAEAEFVVRELSLTGMLVETDLVLRVDTQHHMAVLFPEARFESLVRIAHSEPLPDDESSSLTGATHRVGVEFVGLGDVAHQALETVLAAHRD